MGNMHAIALGTENFPPPSTSIYARIAHFHANGPEEIMEALELKNTLTRRIEDLQGRAEALRGYL